MKKKIMNSIKRNNTVIVIVVICTSLARTAGNNKYIFQIALVFGQTMTIICQLPVFTHQYFINKLEFGIYKHSLKFSYQNCCYFCWRDSPHFLTHSKNPLDYLLRKILLLNSQLFSFLSSFLFCSTHFSRVIFFKRNFNFDSTF
jgi:hypothetical protein